MYNIWQKSEDRIYSVELDLLSMKNDLDFLLSTAQELKIGLNRFQKFIEKPDADKYVDGDGALATRVCASAISSALHSIRNAAYLLPYAPDEIYKPEDEE